jgi:hypothetical protein
MTSCKPAQPASNAEEKIKLRIFYAGHPGSEREKDFASFLKQHFTQVGTGDLANFDGAQAKEADVVLLDYDGDGFKAPRPDLGKDYRRATVTVGVVGGMFCSRMDLKTGYL